MAQSVYVHIPFCRRKCIYCDFYSVGERLADWARYVDALLREAGERITTWPSHAGRSTIYIGGGTPSLIPGEEFRRLAEGVARLVPDVAEFTVEVNPDDVTSEKSALWREAGVNRVSMGVQSLVDEELRFIGRRHTAEGARRAYDILRESFDNISLDLMFALPGQTHASLRHTVEGLLRMAPEHISAYSLTYEERSALTRMRDAGKVTEASEDDNVEMFRYVSETLEDAGYEQYELSNYARPGRRSVHNSHYWSGLPYVGIGPAAHSYDGSALRRSNAADVRRYLEAGAQHEEEHLSLEELREEMIMTRLRTREGLDVGEYSRRFGEEAGRRLLRDARLFLGATPPALALADSRLSLTREGVMVSDAVIAQLF